MGTDNKMGFFLLGVGLGTAAALLFAPKRGEETRNYLRSKTQEGADYLKEQGKQLVDAAGGAVEKGKRAVGDQINTLSNAVETGKRAYRETVAGVPEPAA
jgi:gas vesicle protein